MTARTTTMLRRMAKTVAAAGLAFALGPEMALAQLPTELLSELTRRQPYVSMRESSAKKDLTQNRDNYPIEPGQTLVLGDLEGPGVITHIWTTINTKNIFYPRSLVIRVYYDGAEKPSVEAPFGDFFGVGNGASANFTSAVATASANGRSRNCYWHMPFQKRAKVTVANESKEYRVDSFYYYLDWQKHESLPDDIAYFHARYRQAHPAKPGDYLILNTKGRGHFVGVVYSALQTQIGWFGEGDDRFYVDGEDYPSLSGTGTEDYFGDAWGFREFSYPYNGVTMFEGYMPGDRVSAYRWHVADPIAFTSSLRFEMEHFGSLFAPPLLYLGQFYERPDWLSSVAFWYQSPAVATDEPMPPEPERIPPYLVIKPNELEVRASSPGAIQKGNPQIGYMPSNGESWIEFDLSVPKPGSYRVRAVLGHAFAGGIYQVLIDGRPIGPPIDFYIPDEDELWHDFDRHEWKEGKHTLRFEGRGRTQKARTGLPEFHALQLNAIVLLRMEDVEGYMDATRRAVEEKKQQKPAP